MRFHGSLCFTLMSAVILLSSVHATAAETSLRVMTFNLRYATAPDGENGWEHRKDLLLSTIRKFDPDLLGTQEALAVQTDFLSKQLEGYTLEGVGRDDGILRGEFSALLFKKSRFELADSGTFWLSETPEVPGSKSWDSSLPRIATWAKLKDRNVRGREICFLNTHWDHRGNQARLESARLIHMWLAEHARKDPVIVTGDFNVNESHAAFRRLVSETADGPRLLDVYREVHLQPDENEATFHGFSGERGRKRIDFILASPDLKAVKATIDTTHEGNRYPSDHFPVTAVLGLVTDDSK